MECTAEIVWIQVTQTSPCFKVPRDHPCKRQGDGLGMLPHSALRAPAASREAAVFCPGFEFQGTSAEDTHSNTGCG